MLCCIFFLIFFALCVSLSWPIGAPSLLQETLSEVLLHYGAEHLEEPEDAQPQPGGV